MNNRFSVNDLIYRANKRRSDSGESNLEAQDYGEILDKLQRIIAKNHSAELAQVLYSEEAEGKLKDLIMRYLNSEHMVAKGIQNISELVDMIYDDMAGLGLLSPYLQDSDVEEVNVNGYNGIWVLYKDKKILLMTNYGIKRGVFVVRPGDVPQGKEELASTLDGVQRFWHHMTLDQIKREIGKIDMLVTGASAITPSGIRFGKGHGYFDLEWAMFYETGVVNIDTPVVAVGHDCQVVDVDVEVSDYDTAIDYIVTPTKVLKTRNEFPKPVKGVIWSKLEKGMLEQIPPLQELWWKVACK